MVQKKLFRTLLMVMAMTMCATVQADDMLSLQGNEERNPTYTISVNKVEYANPNEEKATVGNVVGKALDLIVAGQNTQQLKGYEQQVRAAIVRGISGTYRMNVIDGSFTEAERMQPRAYYVDAIINTLSTTRRVNYNEKTKISSVTYIGKIGVNLQFKSAKDDQVLFTRAFSVSEYDLSWYDTAEGAIDQAFVTLSRKIVRDIDTAFPLRANIIEGNAEKKDKQKEVYIDLGTNDGVYKGLHLAVIMEKKVGSKTAQKSIGKLKIISVDGPEVSLCKVQSGGREIKELLDKGETLIVQTTE